MPNFPNIPDNTRFNKVYNDIQNALAGISWMELSYGRSFRKRALQGGLPVFEAMVYNEKQEWISVEPDDRVSAFNFIEVVDAENLTDYTTGSVSYIESKDVGIIVFASLNRIDNTKDYIFDENLKAEVINVLNPVYEVVVNSIDSGIERVWNNYSYSTEEKFYNQNFATFRINCTLNLNSRCFEDNTFNIESC